LLIEDEARIVELLVAALSQSGFAVDAVRSCAEGRAAITAAPYDAAVLDLGLPDGNGIKLLAAVRAGGSEIPILILTARDAVEDRVCGLDSGADDYLVKPFAISELVARVKALLRRPGGALGTVLQAGNVAFDTIAREVRIGGAYVVLPRRETATLEQLMRRLGRVVPRAVLEEKLYGIDEEIESNAVPVHVHHLRRKLLESGASIEIHTVRGVGYLLEEAKR
jgi:DNA-binding response OmpR family regulator